jgi:hypothetical protein
VISGILVLFLAGFAPWSALKIVHFTGEHAHQLHSLGASTVAGAAAGGRMAQKAAPYFSRFAVPVAGGAAGAMAGSTLVGAAPGSSGPVTGPGGVPGGKESSGPAGGSVARGGAGTPPSSAAPPAGPQQGQTSSTDAARPGMSPGSPLAGSTP